MKDYLEAMYAAQEVGTGKEKEQDRGIVLLFHELGKPHGVITGEMRRGYSKALSQLPQGPRLVFRLRAGACLTFDRIAAVCRSMNNISGSKQLPETISGVRQAFIKAETLLLGSDLWKYIEKGYAEAVIEDGITAQVADLASEDEMYSLPKAIRDALRRNGIKSLDDERLTDKEKRKKLSGIGPKKMSAICSYIGLD
jgi:hypothetical protein